MKFSGQLKSLGKLFNRPRTLMRAFIPAMLVVLSFPPMSIWPLSYLAFAIVGATLLSPELPGGNRDRWGHAFYFGSFAFVINLFGFYWVAYLIHEFGGLPWMVAGLLALLSFVLLSLASFVAGALFFELRRRLDRQYWPLLVFAFLLLWDIVDYRFFPWSPVMAVGVERRLMASVGFWGTGGWRILFFAVSTALGTLWVQRRSLKTFARNSLVLTALYLALIFGVGNWRLELLKKEFPARQPVALLQGNVGNYEKKLTKLGVAPTVRNVMRIHQDLIEQAAIHFADTSAAPAAPEPWILWPETSFPGFPLADPILGDALFEWVKLTRGLHLVGAYHKALTPFAGRKIDLEYNMLLLVHEKRGPADHYEKKIRIPFGEYIPFDEKFPNLYQLLPAINHFGQGQNPAMIAHPDPEGPIFVPLICYEILFASHLRQILRDVRARYPGREVVLVNPTNDSWYGPTAEPSQHALLARWQAASHELPLLRPTNTGYSLVVAPWGEMLAGGPRDETLVIFAELPVRRQQKRLAGE